MPFTGTLLGLPDEILISILEALFCNAALTLSKPPPTVITLQSLYSPNILRITAVNKKIREMALGLLRDDKHCIEYHADALGYSSYTREDYWAAFPVFANVINLTIVPHQVARFTQPRYDVKKRLHVRPPALQYFPSLRRITFELKWNDENGIICKPQNVPPALDQQQRSEFAIRMGQAAQKYEFGNLFNFVHRARREDINGILDIDIRSEGQIVSSGRIYAAFTGLTGSQECKAKITNSKIDVSEAGSATKEMWVSQLVLTYQLLPVYLEQIGQPMSEDRLAWYRKLHPSWR